MPRRLASPTAAAWLLCLLAIAALIWQIHALKQQIGSQPRAADAAAAPGDSENTAATPAVAPEQLSTLQSQLSALRSDLAALSAQVQNIAAIRTTPIDPDPGNGPQPTKADDRLSSDLRVEQQVAALDESLAQDPVDKTWSQQTSAAIQDVLSREDFAGTVLAGLDCRTKFCRMEVSHTDDGRTAEFSDRFPMEIGARLPNAFARTIENGDGTSRTVFYLAREGVELPRVP
jgi:hypothetical protein